MKNQQLEQLCTLATLLGKKMFLSLFLSGFLFSTYQARAQVDPVIDIWYGDTLSFGSPGVPQIWCNIPGNVQDPDGSISQLSYTLNGGSPVSLNIGADNRRLAANGDFNIDIGVNSLAPGWNSVIIEAVDNTSNIARDTVHLNYTPNTVWPLTYTIDWDNLSQRSEINDVAHVVDGLWKLEDFGSNGNIDGIRTEQPGYDRLVAIGDTGWTNYEVTVPVTIHSMPGGGGVGVLLRWTGHTNNPVNCSQPLCGWLPLGDIAWYRGNGNIEFYEGPSSSMPLSIGITYMFKVKVETNASGNTDYYMKVWPQGNAEPASWSLTSLNVIADKSQGSLMLISHQADVTFGNVSITPGPLSISNAQVSVMAGGTQAQVSWQTNKPASSTVSYDTLLPYTLQAQDNTLKTQHSILLTGLVPNKLYHYSISGQTAQSESQSTADKTFYTGTSNIVSDDFNSAQLSPWWQFVDPLGDCSYSFTGTGTSDAWLEIDVPAGQSHEVYTSGIRAPHLLQSINNADFELEVKFESSLTGQYMEQGIFIKESATKYLRFDFYSTSSQTRIYSQGYDLPASSNAFVNSSIGSTGLSPLYIRVKRTGNQWIYSYSLDSLNWQVAANFNYAINAKAVGLWGGNESGSSSPAHVAKVDYFFNLNSPIVPEDALAPKLPPVFAPVGNQNTSVDSTLAVILSASDPDGNDSNLTFAAVSLPGFAQFVDSGYGKASIHFNPVAGDEGNYQIKIAVSDPDNLTDSLSFSLEVQAQASNGALVSDDFCSGNLDSSIWTFVDPLNDASLSFSNPFSPDAHCQIHVPAGTEHQVWTNGIEVPHIYQQISDSDFQLEVKFESPLTSQYMEQGIVVKESATSYLRFEFYSTSAKTRVYAQYFDLPNAQTAYVNTDIGNTGMSPLYMRIQRQGGQWTQWYSTDGTTWTLASNFTNSAIAVEGIGLYAGNAVGGNSPAFTTSIDYIHNLADTAFVDDACGIDSCITYNTGCPGDSVLIVTDTSWRMSTVVTTATANQYDWPGVNFNIPAVSTFSLLPKIGQPRTYKPIDTVPGSQVFKSGPGVHYFRKTFHLDQATGVMARIRSFMDDGWELYINGHIIARESDKNTSNFEGAWHDLNFFSNSTHINGYDGGDAFDFVNAYRLDSVVHIGENEIVLAMWNSANPYDSGGFSFRMDLETNTPINQEMYSYLTSDITWRKSSVVTPTVKHLRDWEGASSHLPEDSTFRLPVEIGQTYHYEYIKTVEGAYPIKAWNDITYYRGTFEISDSVDINALFRTTFGENIQIFLNRHPIARAIGISKHHRKVPGNTILFSADSTYTNGYAGGDLFDHVTPLSLDTLLRKGKNAIILAVRNRPTGKGGFSFRMDMDQYGNPVIIRKQGLQQSMRLENIEVYPNPTSGECSLVLPMLPDGQFYSISLVSTQGQVLHQTSAKAEDHTTLGLDLSTYANGIYLVKIQAGDKVSTHRILKQ